MSDKNSIELIDVSSLPKFSGNENVHKFIREFKTAIRAQTDNEESKIKLLVQCLKNLPRGTADFQQWEQFTKIDQIFDILLSKFATRPRIALSALTFWQLRPRSGETLIAFVGRLYDFYHDNQLDVRGKWTDDRFQEGLTDHLILYFDLMNKGSVKMHDDIRTVEALLEKVRDGEIDSGNDNQFFTPQSTFKKQVRYDPCVQGVEYVRDMNDTNDSYDNFQSTEHRNDYEEYDRNPRASRRLDFETVKSNRYSPYENHRREVAYENSPNRQNSFETQRYNDRPHESPRYFNTPAPNRRQLNRGNSRTGPYHVENSRRQNFRERNWTNRAPP